MARDEVRNAAPPPPVAPLHQIDILSLVTAYTDRTSLPLSLLLLRHAVQGVDGVVVNLPVNPSDINKKV